MIKPIYKYQKNIQSIVFSNKNKTTIPLYLRLESMHIYNLKGIHDCAIEFDETKNLNALMGVNGIGKTSILQALACCFRADDSNRQYGDAVNFSRYFPPNSDETWRNTCFSVRYNLHDESGKYYNEQETRYEKGTDRWTPKGYLRPIRDTRFIGIKSCLPTIEEYKIHGKIKYYTQNKDDKISKKILKDAAYILNKDYTGITENAWPYNKKMVGVITDNMRYSELSMGAGERRVFDILKILYDAPRHSLILIDEIELLLHPVALRKLIKTISEISEANDFQIIFTTHSLVFRDDDMKNFVSIKYLDRISGKTLVYSDLISTAIADMTGVSEKPIHIYVEDKFAKAVARHVAYSLNMKNKVDIIQYGSSSSAYTVAAAMIIRNENTENAIILLDGDVDRTDDAKLEKIKKALTGNEKNADSRRKRALTLISQFNLPDGYNPEKFIHHCLLESTEDSEIVVEAKKINAVKDNHDFIKSIVDKVDPDNEVLVIEEILRAVEKSDEWENYVSPLKNWLYERRNI